MAVEVGNILEGKVTGITNFGAFVELEEGKSGMVHISEVAPKYVEKISDFLEEGQTVKVKVLSVDNESGKISLSIKKAMENNDRKSNNKRYENGGKRPFNDGGRKGGNRSGNNRPYTGNNTTSSATGPGNFEWQPKRSTSSSFEDMMSNFKKSTEDKFSGIKKPSDTQRRPRKNPKQ